MSIQITSATEWFRCIGPTATLEERRAALAPTVKYFRRALPTGKVITAPSKDGDGRGPYSPRRLRRMDAQFHRALERAIALGQERPHA
jgi:hypothetical protein